MGGKDTHCVLAIVVTDDKRNQIASVMEKLNNIATGYVMDGFDVHVETHSYDYETGEGFNND